MKKIILIVLIAIASTLACDAQERVDSKPSSLSYKSKEIKSAQYWQKSRSSGQWENRKNSKLAYLGEGVAVDNFIKMFVGVYNGRHYIFLDFYDYRWRYPALKTEWTIYQTIMAALISEADYNSMSSLADGETITVAPRFYHKMLKGHAEYSFPFFLSLGDTELSSSETLYQSYNDDDKYGKDYAERKWKEDYPPINFIVLKRTTSAGGKDVVRFTLYPHALKELIDDMYFEVDYSVYRNLFTEDTKLDYK